MVMRAMRENTKPILWIAVISFVLTIFAVWGLDLQTGSTGSDPNVLGKVNGVPVSRSQYQLVYEQFAQQMRSASDEPLSYAQETFVAEQAWDNIVYSILTQQEIERLGIGVTDQEIIAYLRTTPPIEIRQYFLDEGGNFDNNAYQAALSNPEIDWTNLEALARDRIPRIKLNEYLAAQVHVAEEEVRRAYELDNVRMAMRYVQFPIHEANLEDYEPGAEDLQAYYDEHRDDFAEAEKARVSIVRIPLAPSRADYEDAAYVARRIIEQLEGGEDFADLAKTYSEAPTSFVDGNTGFISRPGRDEPYFEALDRVTDGELAGPVETESGYYVLRRLEKRDGDAGEPEYNVQEILIKPTMSRMTTDSLFVLADSLVEQARQIGIAEMAETRGLRAFGPEPFAEEAPIPTVGLVPSINKFAFEADAEAISDPLRDEDYLYVVRLEERVPPQTPPLEDVRTRVRERVLSEKRREIVERDANAFFTSARRADFDSTAIRYGREVTRLDTIRGADNIDGLGSNSRVVEAALQMPVGEVAPPVPVAGAFFVFELLERSDIDPEDYKVRFTEIRERLHNQKVQAYVTSWYEALREKSEVEDYRSRT